MSIFKRTSEELATAQQRQVERINEHIADLQRQIKEAQEALTGITETQTPIHKNKLHNLLRSIEGVTEVTAYRKPIPKKNYHEIYAKKLNMSVEEFTEYLNSIKERELKELKAKEDKNNIVP